MAYRVAALLATIVLLTACGSSPSGIGTGSPTVSARSPVTSPANSLGGPAPAGLWVSDIHTNSVTDFPSPPHSTNPIRIVAQVRNPEALAFDARGNLWVGDGGTSATPPVVVEYSGSAVAHNANPVATISLLGVGISPEGLAFDAQGNLWVAAGTAVAEYGVASLSRHPRPARTLSSVILDGPDSLAFDPAGDLWVANYNSRVLVEYGAQTLQQTHPAYSHTIPLPSGASPFAIAFNPQGNLWVACQNDMIYEYAAATLGRTSTPSATINMGSLISGGVVGLAFDAQGNLWASAVGQSAAGTPEGVVEEYVAPSLGRTNTPSATLVASVSNNPGTWALAVFPLPTGTGLH